MKKLSAFPIFLWVWASGTGLLSAGDLEVAAPWVRAVPPVSKATAAFMVLENRSAGAIRVTGGACPVSGDVRPMITTSSRVEGREVSGMEFVESFEIPAGGRRVLEPGGDHIMLMQLSRVPVAGTRVPLTIYFEAGGKKDSVTVEAAVR